MSNIDDEEQIEQAAEKIIGILTRDESRKSFDSYAHPDTKERAKSGIMAVKPADPPEATIRKSRIVQPETNKESLTTQERIPFSERFKTCTECGTVFTTYKNGCMEPNVCRSCLGYKIKKGMLKHHGKEASKNTMEEKNEQHPVLTLVFSGKRDARVYEAICASAENDRRTPENQVLHFLEMAMNGFASDVVFALEETITREDN